MRDRIFVILLAFLLLIPWLGRKDFYSRGESREALVAQRMIITHDYILPSSYNDVVPSKPPLLHWFIVGATSLTGGEVTEFSSRFPSAFATVVFSIFLASFLTGPSQWLAPAILITSVEWYRTATSTRVDCLLSIFFSSALLLFYKWYRDRSIGSLIAGSICLSLATMTKGPVGAALPLLIVWVFLLVERRPLVKTTAMMAVLGLISLGLAGIWYWAAFEESGQAFLNKVYYENVARLTGTMEDEPHANSVLYLWGMLILGFMPWTLFICVSSWKSTLKQNLESAKRVLAEDSLLRFCAIWALFVILFFSIPSSKRSTYVLPAYPALAILSARVLLATLKPNVIKYGSLGTYGILLAVQIFFAPWYANSVSYRSFADETRSIVEAEPKLYSYEDEFYGISLYLKKQFYSVSTDDDLPVAPGYIYLFEGNLDALKMRIGEGRAVEVIARSSKPVVKKGRHMLLVKLS